MVLAYINRRGGFNLIKRLTSLINLEDKKNPMTDEELAQRLGVGHMVITWQYRSINEMKQYFARKSFLLALLRLEKSIGF
jgi:hypothetical protein